MGNGGSASGQESFFFFSTFVGLLSQVCCSGERMRDRNRRKRKEEEEERELNSDASCHRHDSPELCANNSFPQKYFFEK